MTDRWGHLAHPIHLDPPGGAAAPWRDNAFLAFWDTDADVYGTCHVSTSPNAAGRRARFSVSVGGRTAEVVEDLDPGTFAGEAVAWDLDGSITVAHPTVRARLDASPRWAHADYSHNETIPTLVAGHPLSHHQRAAAVTGTVDLDGTVVDVDGLGLRDRTWGYRDESANIVEYVAFMGTFEESALTLMRFLHPDGSMRTEGFLLGDRATPLRELSLTRDASGLFSRMTVADQAGTTADIRLSRREAGFWVPMGWERSGPTFSAYDEFCRVTADGPLAGPGVLMLEQGILRRVH